MERLRAHYLKETMSNATFDTPGYSNHSRYRHPHQFSRSFNSTTPYLAEHHVSNLLSGHGGRDVRSMGYRGSSLGLGRGENFFPDQNVIGKNSGIHFNKDKHRTRDYKELNSDLGIFSIDSNGSFSSESHSSEREVVFDIVKQCKAQVCCKLIIHPSLSVHLNCNHLDYSVKQYWPKIGRAVTISSSRSKVVFPLRICYVG